MNKEQNNTSQQQTFSQNAVSNGTFYWTKCYPKSMPDNRYEADKRVVQLEIETSEPLPDEFF